MVRWAAFRVNSCQASNRMCASLHQYLQLLSSFQLVTGKAASGHPVWKPLLTYCVTRWALNCPCSHQRQTMRIGKGTARPLSTSWQEGRHPLQSINFFSDTNLTILVPQGFCRWRDYCRWHSVGWSVWCRGWPDSQKPLCSRVYPYWGYSGNCTVPYCNLDSVFSRTQIFFSFNFVWVKFSSGFAGQDRVLTYQVSDSASSKNISTLQWMAKRRTYQKPCRSGLFAWFFIFWDQISLVNWSS